MVVWTAAWLLAVRTLFEGMPDVSLLPRRHSCVYLSEQPGPRMAWWCCKSECLAEASKVPWWAVHISAPAPVLSETSSSRQATTRLLLRQSSGGLLSPEGKQKRLRERNQPQLWVGVLYSNMALVFAYQFLRLLNPLLPVGFQNVGRRLNHPSLVNWTELARGKLQNYVPKQHT